MFELVTGTGDSAMDVLAFPGSDISGANSTPPLVYCGQHPQLGGAVYLSLLHVVEAVHTAAPVLSEDHKAAIARNIGAVYGAELEELIEANVSLAGENKRLRDAIEMPLAEVIDFAKEKARIELAREAAEKKQPVA